jgi:shikimate dehydrogenase
MITGKTNVVGLIGDPVGHSLSPVMHNAAFKYLNIDFVYVPFLVKKRNLQNAIDGAKFLNLKGLNVTIPHKTEVIKFLDELDTSAKLVNAVNTILFEESKAKGYNTDGLGAVKALEEITNIKDKRIVIMGAGGAAKAVLSQVIYKGAKSVLIANRTLENAIKLRKILNDKFIDKVQCLGFTDELKDVVMNSDIVINTTPVGMYPKVHEKPLLTATDMHSDLIVYDLVYNPLKTVLLKEAEKAGAKPLSGIKMLIYQGMESFKIWTNIYPPYSIFEEALKQQMGRSEF